jgi:hypothetical protein
MHDATGNWSGFFALPQHWSTQAARHSRWRWSFQVPQISANRSFATPWPTLIAKPVSGLPPSLQWPSFRPPLPDTNAEPVMDFYEPLTTYDVIRRRGLAAGNPEEFYRETLALCIDMAGRIDQHTFAVEYNKTMCERDWYRVGQPYFKIFPAMIPLLSNVNVDVPIEYLRPPFAAFLIRLPKQDNPLVVEGEYLVRTILVAEGRPPAVSVAGRRRTRPRRRTDFDVLPTALRAGAVDRRRLHAVADRAGYSRSGRPARTASPLFAAGRLGFFSGDRAGPAD